jgi:SAM-dependent methyltransferase
MKPTEYAAHSALEDTHWWFRARRNIIAAALDRWAPDARAHLLEIGCGTGGNLRYFRRRFGAVTGVDAAPEAIRFARERVDGTVLLGDYREQLGGRWNEFDVILLADVLEHIEDDASFLRGIVESMRPGATLVITVPAHRWLWSAHDAALGHQRRYRLAELRTLWSGRLPVRELYFSPFNTWLLPLVALLRWLRPNVGGTTHSDLQHHGALMNGLLYRVFNSERWFIRNARLPAGCSFLAVLRREGQAVATAA